LKIKQPITKKTKLRAFLVLFWLIIFTGILIGASYLPGTPGILIHLKVGFSILAGLLLLIIMIWYSIDLWENNEN